MSSVTTTTLEEIYEELTKLLEANRSQESQKASDDTNVVDDDNDYYCIEDYDSRALGFWILNVIYVICVHTRSGLRI